jgi:hypothetical protein
MSEGFVMLVEIMREYQRADDEQHTRLTAKARAKAEEAVDKWLDRHQQEVSQLDLWTRSVKHSETAGAYNVRNDAAHEE